MGVGLGLEPVHPGSHSTLSYLCSWASHRISLGLSFLICKMKIIVSIALGSRQIDLENVSGLLGTWWGGGGISCCECRAARGGRWEGRRGPAAPASVRDCALQFRFCLKF